MQTLAVIEAVKDAARTGGIVQVASLADMGRGR
jgi:hypothetical protein